MGFMRSILKMIVIASMFGAFIYYMDHREKSRNIAAQAKLAPFNSHVDRLLKKTSESKVRLPAKGKFLIVDEETRKVTDFSTYWLHPNRKPNSPSEVESVVLSRCKYVQVGTYTNGGSATQNVCNFTVINISSGVWSDWGEFKGTMPPEEIKTRRSDSSGAAGGPAIDSFFEAGGI